MSYSEHQAYYDAFRTGYWAHSDAASCPCRGMGWALSEVDTWHECPVHYKGQRHPEDYEPDEADDEPKAYVVSALLGRTRFAMHMVTDDGSAEALERARAAARTFRDRGGREVKLSRVRGAEAIEKAQAQMDRVADWESDYEAQE